MIRERPQLMSEPVLLMDLQGTVNGIFHLFNYRPIFHDLSGFGFKQSALNKALTTALLYF